MFRPRRHDQTTALAGGLRTVAFDPSQVDAALSLVRSCAALSEAVVPYGAAAFRAAHLAPGLLPERDITLLMKRRRAVGIALVSTRRQYQAAGRAYMEVLYVDPHYRGAEPIQALVQTARAKLLTADLPFTGMFTFLDDRTMEAQQSYLEEMGFSRTRRCRYLTFAPPQDYPGPRLPEGFHLVREVIPGNEPLIAARFNEAFLPPSLVPAVPENFRPLPGDVWLIPDGAIFLYDDTTLAGCVQVLRHYEGRRAMTFIARLGVVEQHRGRGLARQLLRAGIAAGREHGLEGVKLTVYSDTPDAEHIYRSEGFVEQSCTSELSWSWG